MKAIAYTRISSERQKNNKNDVNNANHLSRSIAQSIESGELVKMSPVDKLSFLIEKSIEQYEIDKDVNNHESNNSNQI